MSVSAVECPECHAANEPTNSECFSCKVPMREAGQQRHQEDGIAIGEDIPPWPDDAEGPDAVGLRAAQLRAALLDSAALDSIPPPSPVIDGFLYRDSLAWLHGKPGNGKSFVALDWAGCVAAGLPWQDHEVTQGRVLYLAAEGTSGLRQRVRAWEDRARCKMDALFLPVAVQLLARVEGAALAALAAGLRPSLVVVDTQARVTAGYDENSAKDMGLFVDAADRIRQASGACVLTVHHEARAGENMRGSTALEGAATSIMRVVKDGSLLTLSSPKQKDVPAADDIRLQLVPRLSSAVVERLNGRETFALSAPSVRTVHETLRDAFVRRSATTSEIADVSGLSKATVCRAVSALVNEGFAVQVGTVNRPRYAIAEDEPSQCLNASQSPAVRPSHVSHPFRGETDETFRKITGSDSWPEGSVGAEIQKEKS